MNMRQWLMTRPDGRRRLDVLHLVFISTVPEILNNGRTPFDIVETDFYESEMESLVKWLAEVCPGFWDDLDCNEYQRPEHWVLWAAYVAIRKTGWSALPPNEEVSGKPWGEAADDVVQDFVSLMAYTFATAVLD